ncbi:MAG: hypothetical protein HQL60_00920 [Magnetococcales bacterium]|nr:hypothetical protein [Magnetococcales bacterium]
MSVSPVVGSRNILDAGMLEKIRENASATPVTVENRNAEGASKVAERVRTFAASAYRVALSPEVMRRGAVYLRPQ